MSHARLISHLQQGVDFSTPSLIQISDFLIGCFYQVFLYASFKKPNYLDILAKMGYSLDIVAQS